MLRRKSVLAGIGVALAISMPLALVAAVPAGAANTCVSSINPNQAGAQSGLKVGCLIDVSATPTANADHIEIHDATNASWHRGAARTVTVNTTSLSAAITFAVQSFAQADLRRPISGVGIGAGAFIRTLTPALCTIATCTGGTLSVVSTATGATTATVEHTTARVLQDAHYTAGATSTLSSATAVFKADDVKKSVTGGSFNNGARIATVAVNGLSATVSGGATLAHAPADDVITIGGQQYAAAGAGLATVYTETFHRFLKKVPLPGTANCTASSLSNSAAGGGFVATDVNLKVFFFSAAGAPVAGAWRINSITATAAALNAPCPAAAAWASVVVGEAGADAPTNGATMSSLVASLNLSPTLVVDQDDCNKNTYEGFAVIGGWQNPGSYLGGALIGAPVNRSIAQIAYPTAVISFAGYVVPKTAAEAPATGQGVPHYDFVFPTLPTTLAVCTPGAGVTTLKTAITLGFASSVQTTFPALATGSGNPASPTVRQIGLLTGAFTQKVSFFHGSTPLGAIVTPTNPAGCAVILRTATPTFSCGLG